MLLIKKWFIEIVLVYLPVGHTHEKVDRMLFAKIGKLKDPKMRNSGKIQVFCGKSF
jgi:hypothetical protein